MTVSLSSHCSCSLENFPFCLGASDFICINYFIFLMIYLILCRGLIVLMHGLNEHRFVMSSFISAVECYVN